jgi:WD40 repeat protein
MRTRINIYNEIGSVSSLGENSTLAISSYATVQIWNTSSIVQIRKFSPHNSSITALAKLDSFRLAIGHVDSVICICNHENGNLLNRTKSSFSNDVEILSFLYMSNTSWLISCSSDMKIKVWNSLSLKLLRELKGNFICMQLLKNGHLASGSNDKTIRIWNLKSARTIRIISAQRQSVTSLLSLENYLLASAEDDWIIKIWNTESGEQVNFLMGHTDTINSLVDLPKPNHMASCSNDRTVQIWNYQTGEILKSLLGHEDFVHCLVRLPDGDLASASRDQKIIVWNVEVVYEYPKLWDSMPVG